MNDQEKMVQKCLWGLEDEIDWGDTWKTSCGQLFIFDEGGPVKNGFKFCPYCGAELVELFDVTEVVEVGR